MKNKLKETAKSDGVDMPILIESGTSGGASKFLFNEYASYLQGYITMQSEPIGSKVDRAYAFRQAILDGKIHVHIQSDYLRGEFIKQLRSFPLGKHDDIIDACAYAFNYLNKYGGGSMISVGAVRKRITLGERIGGYGNPILKRNRRRF